jgi:segregation and condensation protein B
MTGHPPSGPELPLGEQPLDPGLVKVVESLLFATEAPLTAARMAEVAGASPDAVRAAVAELNRQYERFDRTFRVHRVAQGFQLYTLPDYSSWVRALFRRAAAQRLTQASLEVLATVAYKQPVTKPEIETLRGVDCSGPLITLLERRLIATAGRARRPGSPYLYRTTREFLRYFGLETLDDLPPIEDLGAFLASREQDVEEVESMALGDRHGLSASDESAGGADPGESPDPDTPADSADDTGSIPSPPSPSANPVPSPPTPSADPPPSASSPS